MLFYLCLLFEICVKSSECVVQVEGELLRAEQRLC